MAVKKQAPRKKAPRKQAAPKKPTLKVVEDEDVRIIKRRAKPTPRRVIHVGKKNIDEGTRGDSSHCMIAQAIAEALEVPERYVSVDLQMIEFSDPKRHLRISYLTPTVCQQALLDFDHKKPVKPFAFKLQNPIQVRNSQLGVPRAQQRPRPAAELKLRAKRVRELKAKKRAGTATRDDKKALTRMLKTDALGGPMGGPAKGGYGTKKRVRNNSRTAGRSGIRVEGGDRPLVPSRNRTLSNTKGRRRQYGVRATER